MTMDYSNKASDFGQSVINAGEAVFKQMKTLWPSKSDSELYSMLGVTPMIGKNDNGKIFTTAHAKAVLAWAQQKKIGHIGFWSLGRDQQCAGGATAVSPTCSSVSQQDHEFSKIFSAFG